MKISELLKESDDELTEFLDKWYFDHALVSSAMVEKMIKMYPQFIFNGEACRVVNIAVEDMDSLHWKPNEGIDWDKLKAFISDHEPKRYVSGSSSIKGLHAFIDSGYGLSREDYIVYCWYKVKDGLDLGKMAESIRDKNPQVKGIMKVQEIIFRPENVEVSGWDTPSNK